MSDNVNKPSHYNKSIIQPIDFIESLKLDFLEGNVVKYVSRYKYKNGLEDLEKANYYLNKLISMTTDEMHLKDLKEASYYLNKLIERTINEKIKS